MSTRNRKLSKTEIERAFADGPGAQFGPVLTLDELETLFRTKKKTLYEWIAKGRLDGVFRKRGKHHLIWRDRAIDLLFNGPEWNDEEER